MKRPGIITVICVSGFLLAILNFLQVFSPAMKKLGVFIPAIFGLIVALQFISCVGLWFIKQWGLRLYLYAFFARTFFLVAFELTGPLFYIRTLAALVFIIILLRHYPRMSPNL